MWVFDPADFGFVQVNKATVKLYGYSEKEFLKMNLLEILQEDDILEAKERIQKRASGNGLFKGRSCIVNDRAN